MNLKIALFVSRITISATPERDTNTAQLPELMTADTVTAFH